MRQVFDDHNDSTLVFPRPCSCQVHSVPPLHVLANPLFSTRLQSLSLSLQK